MGLKKLLNCGFGGLRYVLNISILNRCGFLIFMISRCIYLYIVVFVG